MQASFDDSGNGDQSLTVVAGYFFRDGVLEPFREEWRALLGPRRFHMVDLVHGTGDFADLDETERDRLARALIAAIKAHETLGVAIAVDRAAYDKYIDDDPSLRESVGTPYALCAMLCLADSARWMENNAVPPEETIYFFESGNSKQADANRFLNTITDNSALDERYRYVSHSFVKKNKLATLDAADLLGWEWTQQCRRLSGTEKRSTRASLKSLCEKPHVGQYFQKSDVRLAFVKALLEPYVVPAIGAQFPRPEEPER